MHTTQFAIRDPGVQLLERVLRVAMEEIREYRAKNQREILAVAGGCGPCGQAVEEARLARQLEEMYASVKQAGAGLMVMEPYAFDGELYRNSFAPRLIWLQETTARLAARYADAYIRPPMIGELTQDGLHPTPPGASAALPMLDGCGPGKRIMALPGGIKKVPDGNAQAGRRKKCLYAE